MRCVVCNRLLEPNHRCPTTVEAAWQAKQTRALRDEAGEYETHDIHEGMRLFVGLALWENYEL